MITDQELAQIVAEFWESFLGLSITRQTPPEEIDTSVWHYTSCIHINGAEWEGTVTIQMGEDLALHTASTMFCTEDLQNPDEIKDALGEVINIIGGNIKGLVPSPCRLSLPTVVTGSDYRVRIPGTSEVHRVFFLCNDHFFNITITETTGRTEQTT